MKLCKSSLTVKAMKIELFFAALAEIVAMRAGINIKVKEIQNAVNATSDRSTSEDSR